MNASDKDYWIRIAAKWPFVLVPRYQILYRHPGAMTSNMSTFERDALLLLERAFQTAPPELLSLKKQGFANTYLYSVDLYLTHTLDAEEAKQAGKRLRKAIRLHPRLILDRRVQRLIGKCLLLQSLPTRTVNHLLRLNSRVHALRPPRLEAASFAESKLSH